MCPVQYVVIHLSMTGLNDSTPKEWVTMVWVITMLCNDVLSISKRAGNFLYISEPGRQQLKKKNYSKLYSLLQFATFYYSQNYGFLIHYGKTMVLWEKTMVYYRKLCTMEKTIVLWKKIGTLEKLCYYTENYGTLIYCGKNKSTVEETIVNYNLLQLFFVRKTPRPSVKVAFGNPRLIP